MAKVRCKETTMDSFYGKFLYEQIIPKDHFLVKLKEVIDWGNYTKKFIRYYKGKGEIGQAPYNPATILKMLLVSYLYNISERQTEVVVNENLPTKFFVGLGVNEKSPDHATLTLFKNRLIEKQGIKIYEELFNEIIIVAMEKGVKFGKIQVIDSVHTIANVNLIKDDKRKNSGKAARDVEARWGTKGSKIVIGKDGKKHKEQEYYYGYKDQVSLNAESELITSVIPGKATDWDGHSLKNLIEKDLSKGIAPGTVAADKGYDDGENHYYLQVKGINSAIRLKQNRTKKKDDKKEGWLKLAENQAYREGLKERYKIERKFGEAKKWHGFTRCRYTGFVRHAVQSYLTFMALNLKRLVKLLTGVSFKGEAIAYATSG
jgi:IS5 family transposase